MMERDNQRESAKSAVREVKSDRIVEQSGLGKCDCRCAARGEGLGAKTTS